jgi:hypothetical protein
MSRQSTHDLKSFLRVSDVKETWSFRGARLGVYAGHLQHIDRINSRNPVQICRSAAHHFYWFYIARRDFECTRQNPSAGGRDDRGVRVASTTRIYLYGGSEARRDARRCRQAMVIAGKSEAPVDLNRTPEVAHLSSPFVFMHATRELCRHRSAYPKQQCAPGKPLASRAMA